MSQRARDYLGPSIIIAASVVGTGELVVAPSLGAKVGISALWIIVLGCVIKVFLQEQLGRHTILTGETTLEAFNRVPGKIGKLSWVSWAWLLLLISTSFQQAGILAACTQSLHLLSIPGDGRLWAGIIAACTAVILVAGRYGLIEKTSGILVASFTLMTIIALVLLQRTPDSISWAQIGQGFTFDLPAAGFAAAVTVFGITGIGTSELLFYPYWCLEKGYARELSADLESNAPVIHRRIRGMRLDISVALVVYTFATVAFFLLGATILHRADKAPEGLEMVRTLSSMYTQTFGPWVFYIFAVGAFVVLYSTFFVGLATFSLLVADTVRRLLPANTEFNLRRTVAWSTAILSVLYFLISLAFRTTPHWLIIYGGAVQTILLPIFGFAIVFNNHRRKDPYKAASWMNWGALISLAIIALAAGYSLWRMLAGIK